MNIMNVNQQQQQQTNDEIDYDIRIVLKISSK